MQVPGHASKPDRPASSDQSLGASAQRKAALRLLPVIAIGYGLAMIDRINISFASLRMNTHIARFAPICQSGMRAWSRRLLPV